MISSADSSRLCPSHNYSSKSLAIRFSYSSRTPHFFNSTKRVLNLYPRKVGPILGKFNEKHAYSTHKGNLLKRFCDPLDHWGSVNAPFLSEVISLLLM